jgi:hypothetical protein
MPPRRTGGAAGPVELAAPVLEPELLILRQQWKWAAFCQFFDTFSALFNMPDISVNVRLTRLLQSALPHTNKYRLAAGY